MSRKKEIKKVISRLYYKGFDYYNYPNCYEFQNILRGMAVLSNLYDCIYKKKSKPNKSQRKFIARHDAKIDNELPF